jgi:hypothetical protein
MNTFREQYKECVKNGTVETVNCEPYVIYGFPLIKARLENYQYCKRFNDNCDSATCKHLREEQS